MNKLVSFFEIPCNNFDRAVKFYEAIFDISLSTFDCEHEKMAFFPDEDGLAPGAISWAENFKPSQNGVLISLKCEDINATLSLIEANKGKVVIAKTKIEADNRGYFSVFADCEGNHIGLYSEK
ncbi:VOC family protein [Dysgonomonas sp. Marseille-P4677]|uniref:VOC family protein n=1 Tax=Dysgonomonas sp. Marseille-P4677 TaxID=2364790 RepID=UPI0019144E99|nr:VOC family protein [Dysgonomonas sp. Marseille-P4677]MBK5720453.1 VOC family protein [Dysgonomonas sp. Marseille-P4677]